MHFTAEHFLQTRAGAAREASYAGGIGCWASPLQWNKICVTDAEVHTLQATSQCQYKNLSFLQSPEGNFIRSKLPV